MKKLLGAATALCLAASLNALADDAVKETPAKATYTTARAKCNELTGKERKDCLFEARQKYRAAAKAQKGSPATQSVDPHDAAAAEASHAK